MKWFGKYYELFLSVRFVGAEPRAPVAGPGEVRTNQKRFKKKLFQLARVLLGEGESRGEDQSF